MTGMSQTLQRAQNRANAHNSNGRTSIANLQSAFGRISEKCDVMQLGSNITTRAQHVYKIADEKKVLKGKNESVIIAACIIFACRDGGANRSFTEVCKALNVTKKVSEENPKCEGSSRGMIFNDHPSWPLITVLTTVGSRSSL